MAQRWYHWLAKGKRFAEAAPTKQAPIRHPRRWSVEPRRRSLGRPSLRWSLRRRSPRAVRLPPAPASPPRPAYRHHAGYRRLRARQPGSASLPPGAAAGEERQPWRAAEPRRRARRASVRAYRALAISLKEHEKRIRIRLDALAERVATPPWVDALEPLPGSDAHAEPNLATDAEAPARSPLAGAEADGGFDEEPSTGLYMRRPRPEPRPPLDIRHWIVLLILGLVTYTFVFSSRGLVELVRTRKAATALEARALQLESERAALASQLERIQQGDIEEFVRRLPVVKKGEELYVLPEGVDRDPIVHGPAAPSSTPESPSSSR